MFVTTRLVFLLVCVAIGGTWLTACDGRATPERIMVTATVPAEPQPTPTTVEAASPSAEPPTGASPTVSTDTPVPVAPTSTAAPPPSPPPSTVPAAVEPAYEDRTGPASLLASYYNAINRHDYARAWAYWGSPPNPTYENFVQGFADTASVLMAVRPPTWYGVAAGSTYARVPALMSATHTDGSRHNFVGCFVTRYPNVEGPGVEQVWSLYDAMVQVTPANSTDALLLDRACDPAPETSYDDRTGPVRLLASYYNAINLGEYERAWAYWEAAPNPSFEDFVQGFADTESVMLVVGPPTRIEGAAGSVYTAVPALMSAVHTDGSRHNFVACFTARRPNLGDPGTKQVWSLYDATARPSPENGTDVGLLLEACGAR